MAKKLTATEEMLAKAAKATRGTGKQKSAGGKAVQETITKKESTATTAYNIRLSPNDDALVDQIIDSLVSAGLKRPPASDAFRVALRAFVENKTAMKNPLAFLPEKTG